MKLSKTESNYRSKLFCERHYKKCQQNIIDRYIKAHNETYKNIYKCHKNENGHIIFTLLCVQNLSSAVKSISLGVKSMIDAVNHFACLLKKYSGY